jgi:soluble lytic murein transglycosylase-like protein
LQDNVDAGANYLRSQLDATGNNAIAAIGAYNGVRLALLCMSAVNWNSGSKV